MRITPKTALCLLFISIVSLCTPLYVSAADSEDISASSSSPEGTITEQLRILNSGSSDPSGRLQATFERDEGTGIWSVHAAGTYSGIGGNATIADTYIYGMSDTDSNTSTRHLGAISSVSSLSSPFQFSLPIPAPDLSWTKIGFGIQLSEADKITTLESQLFPIIWNHPILLDHAIGGYIVHSSNFTANGIPSGIGIPHTRINTLPEGTYYAVVFFDGLRGCPSNNYQINSFVPGRYWGYDVIGPMELYSKAWSTSAGGCMQQFHVDPRKAEEWMWGALSTTGTADAIADANDVPAFAICGTKDACDTIQPKEAGSTTPVLEPPVSTSTPAHKASSVLFLPGIKGSHLYIANPVCIVYSAVCDTSVWLPIADVFAQKLFMDPHGKSVERIYAKENDLMSSAFGYSFYSSFIRMMDDAKQNDIFGKGWSWKVISYDWRMSLDDILDGSTRSDGRLYYEDSTGLPYIETSLRELASTSPTGKVTIIAHSNGGLVAKALLQKIGTQEAVRLVDSLILVGTPQSGAPRSLGALLFGEGETMPDSGIFKSIIMSAEHARQFALNSPMAYHLLPSSAYMAAKNPSYPLVRFEPDALLLKERTAYGETIDSGEELHNYALAVEAGRRMPEASDLNVPNVANSELLSYAERAHASLDSWMPPDGMEVYQIGGYGIPTISGIDMYGALSRTGTTTLSSRPLFTRDGDGTVPVISSLFMRAGTHVRSIWVDLSNLASPYYSHANLLEMPYVQNTITSILTGSFVSSENDKEKKASTLSKNLGFFLHGHGTLHVEDGHGRSAGEDTNDTASEEIPGSTSGVLGNVMYVLVPTGAEYTLTISSNSGEESVSLDMEGLEENTITASSTIAEIPLTKDGIAKIMIHGGIEDTSPLHLDSDGDGKEDMLLTPVLGSTVFPAQPHADDNVASSSPRAEDQPSISSHVSMKSLFPATTSEAQPPISTTTPFVLELPVHAGTESHLTYAQNAPVLVQTIKTEAASTSSSRLILPEMPEDHPIPHKESLWQVIMQYLLATLNRIRTLLQLH